MKLRIKIARGQIDTTVGDLAGNVARMTAFARRARRLARRPDRLPEAFHHRISLCLPANKGEQNKFPRKSPPVGFALSRRYSLFFFQAKNAKAAVTVSTAITGQLINYSAVTASDLAGPRKRR